MSSEREERRAERPISVGTPLAGDRQTEPIYSPSSPIHPEEFDMADHRKLGARDEKGFVIRQTWEGEVDPTEWEQLTYLDWKSGGDTNFAVLASATGEDDARGFWEHGKP